MDQQPLLKWVKTQDDPEIHTAEVLPSYRYFLLGVEDKYVACYSSGIYNRVIGYLYTSETKMETMDEAKERCENHRKVEQAMNILTHKEFKK